MTSKMEISRFESGTFNIDDMQFDSIDITLVKVTPEDFDQVTAALKKLCMKDIRSTKRKEDPMEPDQEEEPEKPETPKPIAPAIVTDKSNTAIGDKIIEAMQGKARISATAVAYSVYGKKCTLDQRRQVKKLIAELVTQDVITKKRFPSGATTYRLPESDD